MTRSVGNKPGGTKARGVRVLVFAGDEYFAGELVSHLKKAIGKLPIEFIWETTARRALSEYRDLLPDLVFVVGLPVTEEPAAFVRQMQALSGVPRLFVWAPGTSAESLPGGVTGFALPITQWEKQIREIVATLPETLRIRYGIANHETPLRIRLKAHLQRRSQIPELAKPHLKSQKSTEVYYFPWDAERGAVVSGPAASAGSLPQAEETSSVTVSVSDESIRRVRRVDLWILVALWIAAALVVLFLDSGGEDRILSFRALLFGVVFFATVGWFGSAIVLRTPYRK